MFGFTERQTRFLMNVLLHSGVFVERQYCSFAGVVHGQKSTDFMNLLVRRRYATPVPIGRLHRGRIFHVHYKPLWAAIGEPDSRFRKPAAPGRMIERVMILDAVLDGREFMWLRTATDKQRHFMQYLGDRLPKTDYPRLAFGDGEGKTVRYFPDKLPIGVQPHAHPHVLLYLVTNPSPMDFRLFLLRHIALLTVLHRWTIRLLVPRQLKRAQLLYLRAAREHLAEPLHPSASRRWSGISENVSVVRPGTSWRPTNDLSEALARSALHVSGLSTVTGWHRAPMPCGSPVRRKRPMPLHEITGASSASNSHGSTCISLPWLMSPDPQ